MRDRVFNPGVPSGVANGGSSLAGAVWPRFTLVVVSAWMCALAVAWSPAAEGSRSASPGIGRMSALVAQNCLPVAGFTFTNHAHPSPTNTAHRAL